MVFTLLLLSGRPFLAIQRSPTETTYHFGTLITMELQVSLTLNLSQVGQVLGESNIQGPQQFAASELI